MVKLGFIGFGEAAQAFLTGFRTECDIISAAFDIKSNSPITAEQMKRCYLGLDTEESNSPEKAISGADAIFCLVTADQAVNAAENAKPYLSNGQFWFDGNSCSPNSKRISAKFISEANGRYVDLAIMAPVHPNLNKTPVLISGPHAEPAAAFLNRVGMQVTVVGHEVGCASAIKMIRSVLIKGLEALTAECLLAARRANVDDFVINSLIASDPEMDWIKRGTYYLERMIVHGIRRAAEMQEVTKTLQDIGFQGGMTLAAAKWQEIIGSLQLDPGDDDLADRLDKILVALP